MAKRHVPKAFSADGKPKGHSARVPDEPTTGGGAIPVKPAPTSDRAAGVPKHQLKPGGEPISADVDRLHSRHNAPNQNPPFKHPPATGKLKSAGVEQHARYSAVGQGSIIDSSLTEFSDSTALVIAALAVVLGTLGLFAFGLFGGMATISIGIAAALAALLVVALVLTDRLTSTLGLLGIVVVLALAGVAMWFMSDSPGLEDRVRQVERDNAEFTGGRMTNAELEKLYGEPAADDPDDDAGADAAEVNDPTAGRPAEKSYRDARQRQIEEAMQAVEQHREQTDE